MRWTASDIPDQAGRRAVVTGANSGLGYVVARELARAGADVVLACRDEDKAQTAADRIAERVPEAKVRVRRLDLASLDSVKTFADEYSAEHDALDLLVNNAGVMALPYRRTADGFEMQFGTNHLGHFALTGRLLPRLRAGDDPRVVTVSSFLHLLGKIDFSDLNSERRYRKWQAYGQSKLANLLFAYELQRRLGAAGDKVRSLAAHPGYASTNLQATGPRMSGNGLMERMNTLANSLFAQSAAAGALPVLYAATQADVPGGAYVGPDRLFEMRGSPKLVSSSRASKDRAVAAELWDVSEQLTGVSYAFD